MHRSASESCLNAALFAAFVLLCSAGLLNLHYGIDDIRMLQTFSSDEHLFVQLLQQNLAAHDLHPRGFYSYGYFYHALVYVIARLFEALGPPVDVRLLAWTARFVSFLSFAGLLWVFARLAFALSADRVLSACAALFLMSLPEVFRYAQMIHPDLLQCFLLVSAAAVAVEWQSRAGLIAASFVAGLAFGTKYGGLPLLPFLWMPAALKEWLERPPGRSIGTFVAAWLAVVALAVTVFLVGWLLFNPSVPLHWHAFITQFRSNLEAAARGWGKEEPRNPLLWLDPAMGELGIRGTILIAVGMVGLAGTLWSGWRAGRGTFLVRALGTPRGRAVLVLSAYTVFTGAHLLLAVRMREVRYTFHMIPFAVALTFAGLAHVRRCIPQARLRTVFAALIVAVLLSMAWKAAKGTASVRQRYQDPVVLAGKFIEASYRSDTPILADWYAYIPEAFQRVVYEWGIGWEAIRRDRPGLVVLTRHMSGRWAWKKPGRRFAEQDYSLDVTYGVKAETTATFYRELAHPGSGWQVIWENDEVVLLAPAS